MFKSSVRVVIYAILLCSSLSYSFTALAQSNVSPATLVTAADYSIGAEGLPDKTQRSKSRLDAQIKRQLVSLYGGESGERIPERGYLTDVIWGEETVVGTAKHERILYYSFNVGQWQRKLNSETSVLTRAFLTQPLLVFLADADKAQIATQLATTPLFKQAVGLHKKQVNKPLANDSLLNDLIKALGEQGVTQLNTAQRQASGQSLQTEVANHASRMKRDAQRAFAQLQFANNSPSFNVFEGMTVAGNAKNQLDFNSYSALYYGIQPISQFQDTTGGFSGNLARHFSDVSLIEPVSGWLDKTAIDNYVNTFGKDATFTKKTSVDLDSKSIGLTKTGQSVDVAIFRNNPYMLFDAPQSMNLMLGFAMLTKVGAESLAVFKPDLAKKLITTIEEKTKQAEAFFEWVGLIYAIVDNTQQLVCTITEQKEGLCGDALQKIQKLVSMLPKPVENMKSVLKAETIKNGNSLDTKTFCTIGLAKDLAASLFINLSEIESGDKKFRFMLCAMDEVVTQPLLNLFKQSFPDKYTQLTDKGYDSVYLTADFLIRKNEAPFSKAVDPRFKLESIVGMLVKANLDVKGVLTDSVAIMKKATELTQFIRDVNNNKVELQPLAEYLVDALVNHLIESGKGMIGDIAQDVLLSLTPGKYVQLAYTVGNDGSKLLWDWLTDPNVVKLTMTKTNAKTLTLTTPIPKMKAVRYLKVPTHDGMILDYSDDVTNIGSLGADDLYSVNTNNHLLVNAGFKASVENQSAFLLEDKETIQQLLKDKKVNLMWHVKKFNNSDAITDIPLTQRTKGTAFYNKITKEYNYINFPVWEDSWSNLAIGVSPIVNLNTKNPLNQKVFTDKNNASTVKMYQAIDFTKIYKSYIKAINLNPLKGDTYPLQHKTAGIYSDYTHIKINTGTENAPSAQENLYHNTFSVYVLPNFSSVDKIDLNNALNNTSRLYCDDSACDDNSKHREIQVNFYNTTVWANVAGTQGLWGVWMSDASEILSEPIALNINDTTNTLRLPSDVTTKDYFVVYDDVMKAYLAHSGRSAHSALQPAASQTLNSQTLNKHSYPVIVLKLNGLQPTTTALLKAADRDADGVSDDLDKFPDNFNYAYDDDADTMPDEWEDFYGLNILIDDRNIDSDNDGVSNINEFIAQTDPNHVTVTIGTGDKQVTLTWQKPLNTLTQSICWSARPLALPVRDCFANDNSPATLLANQTSPATIKKLINGKAYYLALIVQDSSGKVIESKLLTAVPAKPYALNDTGITTCSNGSQNNLPCPVADFPNQDAQAGRDVSQNDNSNGRAGFNFVKISPTGAELPTSATSWLCVQDKVTGLMWENKTDDGGLHDKDWSYSWYQPDNTKNGGFAGYQNNGSCGGTSGCDTDAYVQAVNAAGWCGFKDWRLPSKSELYSIVDYSRYNPAIDTAYFPTTQNAWFWSSSPYADSSSYAWVVDFSNGNGSNGNKLSDIFVRLVRGGQ